MHKQGQRLYVGFFSALDYWRGISNLGDYCDNVRRAKADRDDIEHYIIDYADDSSIRDPVARIREVNDLGISLSCDAPLDILVSHKSQLRTSQKLISHLVPTKLPKRSFVMARNNVLVSSPEATFLQLARVLTLPQLLLVGMELCGTYRLDGTGKDGTGFSQRPRLVTTERLAQYLSWCHGTDGLVLARRAARLLMSNSGSPRESMTVLALTIPLRLRGLGLPKPRLNHRKEVTLRDLGGTSQSQYYYDFYWSATRKLPSGAIQKRKVDGEYDSDEYHSGTLKLYNDAQRGNAVQYMGTAHVVITNYDLESADRIIRIARQISRCIWHRMPTCEKLADLTPGINDLLEELKRGQIYPVSLNAGGQIPIHKRPNEQRIQRKRG